MKNYISNYKKKNYFVLSGSFVLDGCVRIRFSLLDFNLAEIRECACANVNGPCLLRKYWQQCVTLIQQCAIHLTNIQNTRKTNKISKKAKK